MNETWHGYIIHGMQDIKLDTSYIDFMSQIFTIGTPYLWEILFHFVLYKTGPPRFAQSTILVVSTSQLTA